MARRQKRFFKRSSPDMGWLIAQGTLVINYGAVAPGVGYDSDVVFNFSDIDELDGVMAKDKSDWFVKRILLDLYPAINFRADPDGTPPVRLVDVAMYTITNVSETAWTNNPAEINTPGFWDNTRRMLRNWNRPAYDPWFPGSTATANLGATAAGGGSPIVRFDSVQSHWGESHIREDFAVSNAGLVPDSAVRIAMSNSIAGPDYDDVDSVAAYWFTRILLQKRRGS